MLSKITIFIFLFLVSVSFSKVTFSSEKNSDTGIPVLKTNSNSVNADYEESGNIYVRVDINGKHYIYEYSPDGSLVSVIEVEE